MKETDRILCSVFRHPFFSTSSQVIPFPMALVDRDALEALFLSTDDNSWTGRGWINGASDMVWGHGRRKWPREGVMSARQQPPRFVSLPTTLRTDSARGVLDLSLQEYANRSKVVFSSNLKSLFRKLKLVLYGLHAVCSRVYPLPFSNFVGTS